MANVKISGLPAASTLTGAELVPIVQSGVTSQTTLAAMPYVPSGTGAVTTTVQAKLRQTVSVKDFGAVGDGVTNDTAAWTAFISYCSTNGKIGYVPSGTYMIDSFSFTTSNTGLHLIGDTYNPQASSFGCSSTIIKLRSASSSFVTFDGCWNTSFNFISFDGGYFANNVMSFLGTSGHTTFNNNFNYCAIYGATPTTGIVLNYSGTLQGDFSTFSHCSIHGYGIYDFSQNALSLIVNTNSNAFNITFEYCYFSSAIKMFDFGAGSCSFYRCDFYRAQSYFFYIRNVTQPFKVVRCYTEQAVGVSYLTQAGTAGVSSPYPISIESSILNSTNTMTLNCQQPVRLIDVTTNGNITISPMATYGIYPVYAESVNFGSGVSFGGSYTGYLNTVNNSVNTVPQYELHARPAVYPLNALTYSATISVDAKINSLCSISVTNGTAFTISTPTDGQEGQTLSLRIYNSSGGAMGTITWGSGYKMSAWTNPASAYNRSITFNKQGGVWYEQSRTTVDIPS
jgi:hypothetical protein